MAKTSFLQNNFLSGELSPLLKGNTSIEQYYHGAERLQNVVIVPQGGVKRRGGLAYGSEPYKVLSRITTTPTMPNGGTAATINDNNAGTTTATTTPIGTINPYVVAQYDLGAADAVALVDIKGASLTVGASDEFVIQHSDDGAAWAGSYRGLALNALTSDRRIEIGESHRYWRLVRIGGTDLGAAVVNISEFNLLKETSTLSAVALLNISPEIGIDYLAILTDKNIQIVKKSGGGLVSVESIASPYPSADLAEVRHRFNGSVCLLFHGEHPTQRLTNFGDAGVNGGANSNPYDSYAFWHIDEAPFSNVPKFDFNDSLSPTPVSEVQDVVFAAFTIGTRYQIDVKGVFSKNISFAGDATAAQQSATAENMRKNLQEMPVFGESGISVARVGANQYRITIADESADAYELFSGFNVSGIAGATMTFSKVATGSPRKEPIWSATRGYPRLGEFFEGRLWLGGTRDKAQTLLGSKSGSFLDFDIGSGEDDEGIFITMPARKSSGITDIYGGRNLLVFTGSGERAELQQNITPATINVKTQTSNGSLYMDSQEIDGAVIFADKNGKTLREYAYSFNEDAYQSIDISVLSSHLIATPLKMGFLTGTSSEDANWLFVVNSTGDAAVLNKLRSQDINGFTSMSTPGAIKTVCVFGDDVAFVCERTINNVTRRFVELLDFDHRMDCSIAKPFEGLTVTGLAHLEGQAVDVRIDNISFEQRVVTSGAVTLTALEASTYDSSNTVEVGINFPVSVKPMPVNTDAGNGSNALRLKRIVKINLRLYESTGVYVDGNLINVRGYGAEAFGQPELVTGIIGDIYTMGGWERDYMPEITCPTPSAFYLQAVECEVES